VKIKYLVILFLLLISLVGCKTREEEITALPYDPPGATITTDKEISIQNKRTISFSNTGVFVTNEFVGARLNDFYQVNESTYTAVITPEYAPINDSPWYSFKIWSKKERNIILNLTYKDGKHRYKPKISYDGMNWELLDTNKVMVDTTINTASLNIKISRDTLWISAQELITSNIYDAWIKKLLKKEFVKQDVVGYSSQGKPITKVEIGRRENKNFLVIIGRNHPPEVTGFFALQTFVETIAGESEIANEFRKNITTVIIPLINPDGVDNGHWRHNYKGVDLNRDWIQFNQPESRAVKSEVEKTLSDPNNTIKFFIDFHSTQMDVFYTLSLESLMTEDLSQERLAKRRQGFNLVNEWLTKLQSKIPEYNVNIVDTLSSSTSPTSDRWIMREFDIPGLTCEVGDETDRHLINQVAETAVLILMKVLLSKLPQV